MKRKLVKQGTATMMISLPSKWIKENHLEKGSEVEVMEQDNDLLIKTETNKEQNKLKINLSGFSPLINQIVVACYIKGANELELVFDNKEDMKGLKKHVIDDLLGFEIIKQTQNTILINDITDAATQEIDDIIKRVFSILDSMVEELLIAIQQKGDISPVIEIDSSVNKFVYFCLRMLNIKGYKENSKTKQIYGIVFLLEQIGDTYKQIAKKAEKIDKNQIEILKKSRESLKIFSGLLFDFNKENSIKFATNYEFIKRKINGKNLLDSYLYQLNESIIKMNNYLLICVF